jgi:putative ABC transport system permease protein
VQPGFNAENIATFWVSLPRARYKNDSALTQFYSRLLPRVSELPGVTSVGLSSRLPLVQTGMNLNPFYAEGDETAATKVPPLQIYSSTDGDYFRTMGISLVAGRTFERIGVQRGDEAIISQQTAEHFWKDPTGRAAIGKRFRIRLWAS